MSFLRLRRALALGCTLAVGLATAGLPGRATVPTAATPLHQLRIYEIFESNKAAFHQRFREHALRIMQRYEFRILAMWEAKSPTRTEFVYLLEWPDEQTKADAWRRFLADEEWRAIKRRTAAEHGQLVGEIEDRSVRLTDYSPALPR